MNCIHSCELQLTLKVPRCINQFIYYLLSNYGGRKPLNALFTFLVGYTVLLSYSVLLLLNNILLH